MKKAGKGIFAPKTLSKELAAICGKSVMPRTEVTKKIWAYIKSKKLNQGRIIRPDAKLKTIFPVAQFAAHPTTHPTPAPLSPLVRNSVLHACAFMMENSSGN